MKDRKDGISGIQSQGENYFPMKYTVKVKVNVIFIEHCREHTSKALSDGTQSGELLCHSIYSVMAVY